MIDFRNRDAGGFTLVELMIVMTVILVLAALIVGVGPMAILQVKKLGAKNQLSVLEQRIKRYQEKYGVYPEGSEWSNGKVDNTNFLAAMKDLGLKNEDMIDPFGNPVIYYRVWDETGELVPLPDFPSKPLPDEVKEGNADKITANYYIWSLGPDPGADRVQDDIVRQG
jgi:prepilin-type N-terminal cleavage/methylation domain-containing protein